MENSCGELEETIVTIFVHIHEMFEPVTQREFIKECSIDSFLYEFLKICLSIIFAIFFSRFI